MAKRATSTVTTRVASALDLYKISCQWKILLTVSTVAVQAVGCGSHDGKPGPPAEGPIASAAYEDASTATQVVNVVSVPTEGTKRMAARLSELAAKANPRRDPTIGPAQLASELRQSLSGSLPRDQQLLVRAQLGFQLLVNGQTEESLKALLVVRQNIGSLNLPEKHSFFTTLDELIALAHLRLAEQQNCIAHHSSESCIMPVQGDGIHKLKKGGLAARAEFANRLAKNPGDIRSVWLLNLTYMILGEYPDEVPTKWLIPPRAFESAYDIGRFGDVAARAGVDTVGLSGGVVVEDFDSDGLLDLMVSDWGSDKQLRLYVNVGDGSFKETTGDAGLTGEVGGLNLIQADYDNDGHVDVLVLRGAWLGDDGQTPNSLLRNLGDGRFDDVTERVGLLSFCPTQTAAWGDYDLDGHIDLFIGNETFRSKDYPCQLYHNNGDGTFTDVATEVGLAHLGRVKGVAWGDIDNDGYLDLYLSRFGESNVLLHNDGPGPDAGSWTFGNITAQANVAEPLGSFPTWFWDYDNDGWLDILVAPFSGFEFDGKALETVVHEYLGKKTTADRIHLYRNNGDGTFTDVASNVGIDAPLLAMGANFGDLDNDGYLDCYFGTGDPHFGTLVPNRMFRNAGGLQFQDVTTSGGFGHIQKGHGVAFADLDCDGDQDIYCVMGGAFAGDVYQNVLFENPGHGNHWITLRLNGRTSNRSAIGARVRITVIDSSGRRNIYATVGSGGSFGASSLQQEIGLGDARQIERIRIEWPFPDSIQEFSGVPFNRSYEIREGDRELVHKKTKRSRVSQQ